MKSLSLRFSNNTLTYIIVSISLFFAFFSYNNSSFGMACIVLTVVLLILNFKTKNILQIIPFFLICGVTMLLYITSGQTGERGFNAPVNHMLKFVYLLFTVALSIGIKEIPREKRAGVIRWVLLSIVFSTLISIYCAVFKDKYAIRYPEERGFTNVVNFGQFYGICIVLSIFAYIIITYYREYPVWKQLVVCGVMAVCVAVSLYVTGVLICVIGVGFGFAIHKYDLSKTKAAKWAFIVVFLVVIVLLFRQQISELIYNATENLNWILRDRLRSVADTLLRTNHNLEYSYDRRDELAGYSIATFKQHPIFGIGYSGYGYGIIGGHQEWQDLLGVFGLVGVFIFVLSLGFLCSITAKRIDDKIDRHAFFIAVVLFGILGFLNPCLNLPVLTAVFVIAPNLSLVVPWWKEPEYKILERISI